MQTYPMGLTKTGQAVVPSLYLPTGQKTQSIVPLAGLYNPGKHGAQDEGSRTETSKLAHASPEQHAIAGNALLLLKQLCVPSVLSSIVKRPSCFGHASRVASDPAQLRLEVRNDAIVG